MSFPDTIQFNSPVLGNNAFVNSLASWGKPAGSVNSSMFNLNSPALSNDPYSFFDTGLSSVAGTATATADPTFWQSMLGWKDSATGMENNGWASPLLGLAQTGLGAYMGLQQLGLAEDTLNFQKDAFSKQFENQRTLTNSQLRDRQAARVASNPTAYQSVEEYMAQNGV